MRENFKIIIKLRKSWDYGCNSMYCCWCGCCPCFFPLRFVLCSHNSKISTHSLSLSLARALSLTALFLSLDWCHDFIWVYLWCMIMTRCILIYIIISRHFWTIYNTMHWRDTCLLFTVSSSQAQIINGTKANSYMWPLFHEVHFCCCFVFCCHCLELSACDPFIHDCYFKRFVLYALFWRKNGKERKI